MASSLPAILKRSDAMVSLNCRFQAEKDGYRLFVEQLLDAVFELVGLLLAHVLDPRPVMPKRRIAHGGFQRGILDAVELDLKE